jgi:hypothetical protein
MGFYDIVQAYFVQATGRFVMFSGRDVALLQSWKAQGATAAAVCRGIRDAVRQLDRDDPPRSVYNCRKFIKPYIERASARAVGAPTRAFARRSASPRDHALAELERAGRACDEERRRALYRDAWYRVHDLGDVEDIELVYAALLGLEEWLSERTFEGLPEATRAAIDARIDREAVTLDARMSERAWELHRVARRRQILGREHDLVTLLP